MQAEHNWQTEALADLIWHIKNTHHKYTREEITRLGPLFDKVCSVHGKNHPELLQIRGTFQGLAQELTTHLMKEEMVLFPYIVRMEEATIAAGTDLPRPFGTVQNPVSMMEHEHDSAGNALRAMREASNGYSAPADACVSYQTLYKAWRDLRRTCTSTFISKTTFCFRARLRWKRLTDGSGFHVPIANPHRERSWSSADAA